MLYGLQSRFNRKAKNAIYSLAVFFLMVFSTEKSIGGEYEFHIDTDRLSGAPVSKLNKPLTEKDIIHANKGHFFTIGPDGIRNTSDDRRIKFWGVNMIAPLVFPRDKNEANKIASRLSKMGFNLVRIHGIDYKTDKEYKSLFSWDQYSLYPDLNKKNLHALDRLFDAFKSHGIYVDLVLKSNYKFDSSNDCYLDEEEKKRCVPDPRITTKRYPIAGEMPPASEPLDLFNHEMRVLQKKYFKEILTRYKEHPSLALIEINNENSLIESFSKGGNKFPPSYSEELDKQWNLWLLNKYKKISNIKKAWNTEMLAKNNSNLVKNGRFDQHRNNIPVGWKLNKWEINGQRNWGEWQVTANNELKIALQNVPDKYWYFFINQDGISIKKDHIYRLSFTAYSDIPRTIRAGINSKKEGREVNAINGDKNFRLSNIKRTYTVCFNSLLTDDNARLTFLPVTKNDGLGKLWIDNIVLSEDAAEEIFSVEMTYKESTEKHVYITRPDNNLYSNCPDARQKRIDYLEFLAYVEKDYYKEMVNYIRDELNVYRPITGTQSNYGGLLSHKNMVDTMDYLDIHFYWDHPSIPTEEHDGLWFQNKSMLDHPSQSVIKGIVEARAKGKPFTISEYSPNQLSQYAQEGHVLTAAYAALQDIDGVFLFSYYASGGDIRNNLNPDRLTHMYNVLSETRVESLMHFAANIFRRGDVSAAKNIIELHISQDARIEQVINGVNIRNISSLLQDGLFIKDKNRKSFNVKLGLTSRTNLTHESSNVISTQETIFPEQEKSRYISDTGELSWVKSDDYNNSYFILDTPLSKAVTGYIGREIKMNDIIVKGIDGKEQYGTVAITSLDGKSINNSHNILITSVGKGKNQNTEYVKKGKGVTQCVKGIDGKCMWPFWHNASGSFVVDSNQVEIQYTTNAKKISVVGLSITGSPMAHIDVIKRPYGFDFTIGRDKHKTPWYLINKYYDQ